MEQPKYIRLRQLANTRTRPGRLPVSAATIWRWVKSGNFPPSVKLGPQLVAWRIEDIEAWEAQRNHAGAKS